LNAVTGMKIVVDINHPAHVHYFKNFIWKMRQKGHEILITASEKDISYRLLDAYGFSYIRLGSYGRSLMSKIVNVPLLDIKMLKAVKTFNPDLFLGFGSIRAAHVATIMNRLSITLDDSEPSLLGQILYVPWTDAILTPTSFNKTFGSKHFRFNGYIELAYLHPHYYTPDPSVLNIIGKDEGESFVFIRFVAWNAVHDVGKKGFTDSEKVQLLKNLSKYADVYISSEGQLPSQLEKYRIQIPPEQVHDLLYYSRLFIGDSQTMTTESALLGTPAVRYNSFVGKNDMGNFVELENKYGLVFNFNNAENALQKAVELITQPDIKKQWNEKKVRLLKDKIDVTEFLIRFIEHYPDELFPEDISKKASLL